MVTHAEEIIRAVATLIKQGKKVFSRKDVRDQIGLSADEWQLGYTAIFQAMRIDHPGGAPQIGSKYKNVFERIERGKYVLTSYGRELTAQELIRRFEGERCPYCGLNYRDLSDDDVRDHLSKEHPEEMLKWFWEARRRSYHKCRGCGKRVTINDHVCPYCGFDLDNWRIRWAAGYIAKMAQRGRA